MEPLYPKSRSPVASCRKFSTVFGTSFPKRPMTTRPAGFPPIATSKYTLFVISLLQIIGDVSGAGQSPAANAGAAAAAAAAAADPTRAARRDVIASDDEKDEDVVFFSKEIASSGCFGYASARIGADAGFLLHLLPPGRRRPRVAFTMEDDAVEATTNDDISCSRACVYCAEGFRCRVERETQRISDQPERGAGSGRAEQTEQRKLRLGPQASTRAHVTTHRARRPCAIAAPAYQSPCVERPPRARAFDRPEVRRGNRSARATSPILPDDGPRRRDGDWGHEQAVLRSREDRTRREPSSRIF
eukprot:30957-Pelagococcus_subviridis.AAC.1